MRKDLKLPRTVEEMETRIKNASFQLRIAPRTVDRENLRQRIGYVFDEREIYPPEIREEIRRDLDRRRRKLSDRVRRRFEHSAKISLVCDLLRESPIFLQDQWIVDLFIERKVTALTDGLKENRKRAIEELSQLSESLLEVRTPSGEWRRTEKSRPLSAARHEPGLAESALAIGAYTCYLDIATCLIRFRELVRPAWRQARAAGTSKQAFIAAYADQLKIPARWIEEWKPTTKAHTWAKQRAASRYHTTPACVAKVQRESKERLDQYIKVHHIVDDATKRLAPIRRQRDEERRARGEIGPHRRY